MHRSFYLNLAEQGLRMPIGTDLVLNEQNEPEEIMNDGRRLGDVMIQAARRYRTPLAISLMDLRLEKADLLSHFGVSPTQSDTFHFSQPPQGSIPQNAPLPKRTQAQAAAVAHVASKTNLIPIGMAIGPFSLMTKLMADPIAATAMAGRGLKAEEDPDVLLAERCLALAETAVHRSVQAQVAAGAKAVVVCEPAANRVYISPKQLKAGSTVFERWVMQPNLRLKQLLTTGGADLIFHNCGELITDFVRQFAERLDPVILSLGSSRKLWEDSAVVPKHIVLYGNLPTKSYYSDEVMPVEKVKQLTRDLIRNMRDAGHPHILGSECDVLHVPDASDTIRHKVEVMLTA